MIQNETQCSHEVQQIIGFCYHSSCGLSPNICQNCVEIHNFHSYENGSRTIFRFEIEIEKIHHGLVKNYTEIYNMIQKVGILVDRYFKEFQEILRNLKALCCKIQNQQYENLLDKIKVSVTNLDREKKQQCRNFKLGIYGEQVKKSLEELAVININELSTIQPIVYSDDEEDNQSKQSNLIHSESSKNIYISNQIEQSSHAYDLIQFSEIQDSSQHAQQQQSNSDTFVFQEDN